MKNLFYKTGLLLLYIFFSFSAYTQTNYIDSLKSVLFTQKEDSNKVKLLTSLSYSYLQYSADTAANYAQKALSLAEKINFERGIYEVELSLTASLMISGNYPLALDHGFKFLTLAQKNNDTMNVSIANAYLGYCYYGLGDYNISLKYYRENFRTAAMCCPDGIHFAWANLAHVFHNLGHADSAMQYAKKAYAVVRDVNDTLFVSNILGDAYAGKGNYDSALYQYRLSISTSIRYHTLLERIDGYNGIALVYKTRGIMDSAEWYSKQVLNEKIEKSYPLGLLKATNTLADIYGIQNKPDSALKYLRRAINLKEGLFSREKTMAIQNVAFKEQEKQKEVEAAKLQSQNRLKMYSLLGGLFTLLAIAGLLFRNNRQKQKANTKIEKAFIELKSTQAQLIQKEKMASLGELTAGIAHEIQNPLNFVNNFSDVNKELLTEMKDEIDKGNLDDAKAIANDIIYNEEKINHHGKRADAIVKGMLQHSQSSSATKEPTDINKLADEYLRLSYHGLRAKDKSFNATMQTNFDETIGNMNIIPQDIGRVLLNLYNNAFYAVDEKKKAIDQGLPTFERLATLYEPTVSVSTKKVGDTIEIKVTDNGNGIPKKIVDKIFQPFFTTKPTGQGTGLGLSLAYDIVKAHGGELKVETKVDEGNLDIFMKSDATNFIILLPYKTTE